MQSLTEHSKNLVNPFISYSSGDVSDFTEYGIYGATLGECDPIMSKGFK